MASALTRSLPSGKELTTSASTAGEASAPPTPWMARAASSIPAVVARPPASEASVKMVRPAMNMRRRPRMSPARPPSSSSPPNVSVYPFITQDRLVEEKCRPFWMCGSAMFTTVASRMIMSCAPSMMVSARFRRPCLRLGAAVMATDMSVLTWLSPMYDEERFGGPLRLLYGDSLRLANWISEAMSTAKDVSVADDDVARNEVSPAGCWDEPGSKMRADARRSRIKLLEAATAAFAEHGADAPLDDIARRAGVGIGTLYRHFPTRTDLQAAVYRSQVLTVCAAADELIVTVPPEEAFFGWVRAMAGYLATKRGLSRALIEAVGKDSELISGCWVAMRESTDRLLAHAQQAGVLREDISAHDVLRLIHGITIATEQAPADADRLLALVLDGLRPQAAAARPAAGHGPGEVDG